MAADGPAMDISAELSQKWGRYGVWVYLSSVLRFPFRHSGEGRDPVLVFSLALPFKGRVGWGWCSHFVIPAKAGIQFLSFHSGENLSHRHSGGSRNPFALSLNFGASREPTHVPVSFPRIPARESLSLACARESNQREHTLAAAVAGLLPGDSARTLRTRAHPCARPCGLFPPRPRRGREGTR